MPPEFEKLIEGHSGRIRAIARRYADNSSVDDLYQEILEQLWRSFKGFRGKSKPETWIYRVGFNTAMTRLRRNVKQRLGMLAMVSSCVFVAGKIYLSRRLSTADDWTLSAKLNIQIEKREKDAKLLRTVGYWYLSPLFVAVILSSYGGYAQRTGSYVPDVGLWTYWAVCLVVYIGIYFFNQYQIKTKVHPILNELRALKHELES